MPEPALAIEGHPLSQTERVVDTFFAPSKTFTDILRNASWWLPFLIIVVCSYVLTGAIQSKVGWRQMAENSMHANPRLSDKLASMPADQVARQQTMMQKGMQYGFYASPLINLLFVSLFALVLWGTINFGFGGSATFGRIFCVGMYSALPGAISALLAAIMLFAGRSPETFTQESMLGSNAGYYIDTPGPLKTFLTSLDLFTIWTMVLLSIGIAIVARTKRSAGYFAVFGWFVLIVLFRTALAAASS